MAGISVETPCIEVAYSDLMLPVEVENSARLLGS